MGDTTMASFFRSSRNAGRGARRSRPRRRHANVPLEQLEARIALAATSITPAIAGTVYRDDNSDSQPSAGEGISGVTIQLYLDDGDGLFEPGTDDIQQGSDATTDANGEYCFDNLDPSAEYFVYQPAQTVGTVSLDEQTSSPIAPGDVGLLIDDFFTSQAATASPPAPSTQSSLQGFSDETEVIGQERDLVANLVTGDGEVEMRVNPFGGRDTLRFNADVGATGSGQVIWDGVDGDAASISLGLSGRDLTQAGSETGIALWIGAALADATATVRIYQGSDTNTSELSIAIPVTSGGQATSYQFLPFSSFTGSVSPTDVDAIELFLDANTSGANDIEVGLIGANGPKTFDISNTPTTDLAIAKTDNQAEAVAGSPTTYTITVVNNGPVDVVGATVTDTFPAEATITFFTSTATGTASGNTPSGASDINDTVNLAVGDSITYTAEVLVNNNATGTMTNIATITPPTGILDSVPENNNAVDIDTITFEADLFVLKDDGTDTVVPGETIQYTITVVNTGPSDARGVTVQDMFPATLLNVSYTSTTTGNVSGNTSSGTGDINDTVDIGANGNLTYTVQALVSPSAVGELKNTATVAVPSGITELDPTDNSATDIDTLTPEVDLSISKDDGRSSVLPNEVVTYTIVVSNSGPSDAVDAVVSDPFPAELTNISYTSTATAGVSGNTLSGNGDLNDTVTIPAGGSLTYQVTGTVASSASGSLNNTATITAAAGTTEPNRTNNSATDVDVLLVDFDLRITKTDNRTQVVAGDATSYTIEVVNDGPSDATDVLIRDSFPAELTSVSYTSVATAGASGHSSSGTGDINDLVNLPSGSSILYLVDAVVRPDATGTLKNEASVTAGETSETVTTNNTATDVSTIVQEADLSVTKTDGLSTVMPGQELTYTIVVENAGPSDVIGATITDSFDAKLTAIAYTSLAEGGASGNGSGVDSLVESVDMPAGSRITYTVTARVVEPASGSLTNIVEVAAPAGVAETRLANNMARDTDIIEQILRRITGSVYVDINGNAMRDAAEPGVAGAIITLTGTDNANTPVNLQTTTDSDGQYEFAGLAPGTYTIRESQPSNLVDGSETLGSGALVAPEVADDLFSQLVLGPDEDAFGFDFGEILATLSKRDLLASRFRE